MYSPWLTGLPSCLPGISDASRPWARAPDFSTSASAPGPGACSISLVCRSRRFRYATPLDPGRSSLTETTAGLPPGTPVVVAGADTPVRPDRHGRPGRRTPPVSSPDGAPPSSFSSPSPFISEHMTTWSGCFQIPGLWTVESSAGDAGNAYRWLSSTLFDPRRVGLRAHGLARRLRSRRLRRRHGYAWPVCDGRVRAGYEHGRHRLSRAHDLSAARPVRIWSGPHLRDWPTLSGPTSNRPSESLASLRNGSPWVAA